MNFKTACNLLNLPRECQCQRTRHLSILSFNDTRLRCRQLTEITRNYYWSNASYDHLAFETSNNNLTLYEFAFANIVVRTLRFNVEHLTLNDHTFDNAHIGQLAISHQNKYGHINFEFNQSIFYGTTITNLYFKFIDFHKPMSELIFSNSKIYSFLIQSSKFYGFKNSYSKLTTKNLTRIKYDHFLEYEIFLPINLKKISHHLFETSDKNLSNTSSIMNLTSMNNSIYITILTIISSINTTNLTENFFPNNVIYSLTKEIELNFNQIESLNAYAFRHLKQFQGRLILINNKIKYLNLYSFSSLSSLKNLSLAKNFIRYLSSIHFKDLKQLYELDLSYNRIYELDKNIFKYLYNLHILYLSHNPLRFIHSNAFSNLKNLKQIHFQGVEFIHLIDQQHFQWIWNLATLRVIHLIKTDFDLSDIAFCILSYYNRSLFHLSRQNFCSCSIHYLNRQQNSVENILISRSKHETDYLRLTPVCHKNDTKSIFKQHMTNENDLTLQGIEDKCDYKLMLLDCDAMTTTTATATLMTNLTSVEIEPANSSNIPMYLTTEASVLTTAKIGRPIEEATSSDRSLKNIKKLFTVLATLLIITIGAIIFVLCWYYLKAVVKQKKNKKDFIEHEQHFNSMVADNHHATAVHYHSSDTLASAHSIQLSSHSETMTKAPISPVLSIDKNLQENDLIENFIDDESLRQYSTDDVTRGMQAISQC